MLENVDVVFVLQKGFLADRDTIDMIYWCGPRTRY